MDLTLSSGVRSTPDLNNITLENSPCISAPGTPEGDAGSALDVTLEQLDPAMDGTPAGDSGSDDDPTLELDTASELDAEDVQEDEDEVVGLNMLLSSSDEVGDPQTHTEFSLQV